MQHLNKIKGDSKITAIRDAESVRGPPVILSRMPKAVVIFSKYTNRRGIYVRSLTPYEGFPVYTDAEGGLSLWHDLGNRWVCSGSVGKGATLYADDRFYLRSEHGPVALIKASPDGYEEVSRFDQPNRSDHKAWPHPVVANGKLYLRDQDLLLCYDVSVR